jgi:peptidylprolyl isomerase
MKSKFLKNKLAVFMVIFLIFIGVMIAYSMEFGTKPTPTPPSTSTRVMLVTSMGNITIELYDDMPITTANFLNLTRMGVYDNTIFHRVIAGFMVQGGDPTGTGLGSPSIASIRDEFTDHNRNDVGTIAMAKKGNANGSVVPNSATSQFFINVVNNSQERPYMDQGYSVFGKVIDGMEVVNAIASVKVDSNSRPLQDVKLVKAIVLS